MGAVIGFLFWCLIIFILGVYGSKIVRNWPFFICLFTIILLFILGFLSTFFFFGLDLSNLGKLFKFFETSSFFNKIGEIIMFIVWIYLFTSALGYSLNKDRKLEIEESEDMEPY